jgi:transcriptional regulator with XRE-family HTH domain
MSVSFRGLQERLRERLLTEIAAGELTGVQLANEIGFQQAHISNFLNRKRGLSLEAMDAILKARKLKLSELITKPLGRSAEGHTIQASAGEVEEIPLLEEKNCLASEVPYDTTKDALKVMAAGLEKLPVRMHTPRPHWLRFIAIRVSAANARAMAPRMPRGAMAVVDRHSNSADEKGSIYLIAVQGHLVLRYVEMVGSEAVLRANHPKWPLLQLDRVPGRDPLAAVLGRVCLVVAEV